MVTIYKVTNLENKIYIGHTYDLNRRIKQHVRSAKKGKGFKLQESIRKYGFDTHTVEILEEYEGEKWINYWIVYRNKNSLRKIISATV